MSVVNTMLRELAARQPPVDGTAAVPLAVVTPLATGVSATTTPRRWPWWFLAMLILATVIAGWRWSEANRNSATAVVALDPAALDPASLGTVPRDPSAAGPASMPAAAIAPASTEPVQTIANAITPAASEPVASISSRSSNNSSNQPASIGWELVQVDDSEQSELDENEQWPVTTMTTPDSATISAGTIQTTAATSHFDRQPASLTVEEQVQQQREQARLALASGDPVAARRAISQGLQLRDDDEQLLALQLQLFGQTDPVGARLQAEQLLQAQPQRWRIRQWLGTEQLQQQQAGQAKATLQIEAPMLSSAPDYHAVLALAEQQTGDHQAAANRYRQLLLAQPQHGRHYAGLALSLDAIGERSAAIAAWRRALADPALPAAVARFGQQRLQQFNSPATQASP